MFQKLKNFAGVLVDASEGTQDNNSKNYAISTPLDSTNASIGNSPSATNVSSVSKSVTIESESIAEKTDAVATGTNDITAIKSFPTKISAATFEMRGRRTTSARTETLTTGVKKSAQPQPEKTTDTTTGIVANNTIINTAGDIHIIMKLGLENGALPPAPEMLADSLSSDNNDKSRPSKDLDEAKVNPGSDSRLAHTLR